MRRWSWLVGLVVVVAAVTWWALGGRYGPQVPVLGLVAIAVAAGTGLRREDLTRKPLGLDRVDAVVLVLTIAAGVAWTVSWRSIVGLSSDEAMLIQTSDKPWADAWTADKGLPSFVHGLLIAPTLFAGGIGAILVLHALLYVVFAILVLATMKRAAGPGPARLAAVLVLLDPSLLLQFQELRAYATFLTSIALASLALVPRGEDDAPRWTPTAIALGLAALDLPIAGVLLVGVALAALIDTGVAPRRLLTSDDAAPRGLRSAAIVGIGLIPTVATAMSVRAEPRPAYTLWLLDEVGNRVALVTIAVALVLGLFARRTRPGALPTLLGLAAIVKIWVDGTLLVKEKYVLFLLPLGVATALTALGRPLRRLGALGSWIAVSVLLAGVVAARHSGPVIDALDKVRVAPLDAEVAKAALLAAVIGALVLGRDGVLATLRGAAVGAVIVFATLELARAAVLEHAWLRVDAAMRRVADATTAQAGDGVICAPEPKIRLRLQALSLLEERPSWWSPLRRPDVRGVHDRIVATCPADGAYLQVHEEHGATLPLPDGCAPIRKEVASPADQVVIARCG